MPFTRELRRRYQAGDIGEVRYAEAEYLDEPADLAWFVGARARRGRGWAALLVVRLDNGDRGLMENLRHGDTRTLRVVWDAAGQEHGRAEEVYRPWPPEFPASTADPTGDGVAETLMLRDFAGAVRHQTPSPCLAPVVP
jgi:hypothetical protein